LNTTAFHQSAVAAAEEEEEEAAAAENSFLTMFSKDNGMIVDDFKCNCHTKLPNP